MSTITLESIEAKQSELQQQHADLQKLIEKLKAEKPRTLAVPAASIELAHGEHYAGLVLGEDGKPTHHLILLAGAAEDLTWDKAKEWAAQQGGELPTRREQSLLFANLKSHFEGAWCWTGETFVDPDEPEDTSYAWLQDFSYGFQCGYRKDYEFRARAVRRLPI